MKKPIWLLLLVCGSYTLQAQTLTLKEAVSQTLAHHPDVKRFMLRIKQAEEGYNAAYADYLPQIDLSATYNPTQTYVMPQNGSLSTIDDDGWNAGVTLHQKVWDFERTNALIEASKIDEDISKLSLAEVKALLAFKVRSLYELLIVQKEAIRVREKDLEAKKAFYAQAKALVKQGLKTHADASRFLSAVYLAEDNLAIAKASFDKAKSSLSLYMGKPISDHVKLQSHVLKRGRKESKKRIEAEVLRHNHTVQIDTLAVEKSRQLHRSAHATQFGSVDVVASHNRFETLNSYNTDYVGINYSVPLFTGGRLSAQEQQAKIGYQIAREQKASDIIALKEELRNLLIDIDRYGRTIKAKKAQLASAQKSLKLVSARYKEGLATYIEVLDSTSQVLAAKLGVLEAYYSRSLALERIEYLKGTI